MTHRPATGVAAGVPYLAVPPERGPRPDAPVVVAWHLLDPPRTEAAFAAALPLAGLDAWRVYLGLPLTGARSPAGGMAELARRAYEDAVLQLHGPIADQAVAEFPAALGVLRERLGLDGGPVGVVGGSLGAMVAGLVAAESDVPVEAAVLISPMVRLRSVVDAIGRQFGVDYPWSEPSLAVADRLDLVARVGELAGERQPAVLLVVGEDDDADGFRTPAGHLHGALVDRYADPDRAALVTVPGLGHALAEEPGIAPAPQTAAAAEVDRYAAGWLTRHLRS